jgi:PAS domain S-box-containing protein
MVRRMIAESNNSAQNYFNFADVIMIAIDNNETVVDINKKGLKILGCSRDEVVGKNWFDVFVPKLARKNAKQNFQKMLKGKFRHAHSEYPVLTKKGVESIINWHNILVSDNAGNTIGAISSGADVTKLRRAEKTTLEIENRLQRTMDSMLEGCQIIDYDWRYLYVNETVAKQGRRSKKELIGHTMMEMYPGIEQTELFRHLQDAMTKRIPRQMENRFTFPDGSKGWFELRIEPVPEGILILSIDITGHRKLEEELNKYRYRLEEVVATRTSECAKVNERLMQEVAAHKKVEEGLSLRAAILDNAREVIFLVNPKGDFVYANETACKTYGYTPDEFLNMNLRQLLLPKEAPIVDLRLREVIEKGQLDLETVHLRKDNFPIQVEVRYNLIKTVHGQFIVCVVRDMAS